MEEFEGSVGGDSSLGLTIIVGGSEWAGLQTLPIFQLLSLTQEGYS